MQRLALAKEASSHTPSNLSPAGPQWDLSSLDPSVLLVHQPPAGFISFPTELGPRGHGFNRLLSASSISQTLCLLPCAPCQTPTPDAPQQSISLPCTIRAKPSQSGESHHPTGGHREGVGFVDLSWILHTVSHPFFSGTFPSPHPQVPGTPSTRGQV